MEQLDLNRGAQMFSCAIFAILFGLIGFIDDFKKVVQKKNDGLSPMQKIVLQVVVAAAWLGVQYWLGDRDTRLDFSFFSSAASDVYKRQFVCCCPCSRCRFLQWHSQAAVWDSWFGICIRQSVSWGTLARCIWVHLS